MKYLNAVITLKDAFTGVLGKIKKEQLSFVSDAKSVSGIVKDAYKLDPSDIKKAIKDINEQIEDNKSKLKEAQKSMNNWKELLKGSEPVVRALSRDVQDLHIKKQKLNKELEKSIGDVSALNKYSSALKDIDKALKDKTLSLNKAKSENNKYAKGLKESQKEVSGLDVSISSLTKKLEELSSKKKSFSLRGISDKINDKYDARERENDKYSGFNKLGDSIKGVGKGLTAGITAPLSLGIGGSIKVGVEFEAQMSSVEATLGNKVDPKIMQTLKDKAMEMGANTTKSATESAQAMGYMALAGWDVGQILGGIEPVLRLSEAGKMDLATTANLASAGMATLGLEVNELGTFLDKVARTSTSAKTTAQELMEAFVLVGGKARSLGADTSELSAILGIMGNNNILGAEAGRGLSAILTNLTSPTGQAKEALNDLNFSAFDAQGNFIGLEKTFKKLESSLKGMTQEQKVTYTSMIAGKEHGKTLEAILGGLSDGYDSLKDSIVNSNGALNNMASTMQNNTAGGVAGLKSKIEDLGIRVADTLLPYLKKGIDIVGNLIDKFRGLSPETQSSIVKFSLLAMVIPPLIIVGGALVSSIGSIARGFKLVGTLVGKLPSLVGSLSTAIGGLSKAFTFLSANPVVAIIGGLVGVVLVVMYLWKTNEKFRDAIHNIWQGIVETVEWATNKIIDGINWVINKINAIPFVNIKTVGHVEWSEKSKNNSVRKANESITMSDGFIAGSYKTGLSYVPYDGFIAELHKGERVLTAEENKHYSRLGIRDNKKSNDSIIKMINSNKRGNTTNNTSNNDNRSSNITVNVSVNANGVNTSNNIDINNMANEVANIIANKIRMAKINVV